MYVKKQTIKNKRPSVMYGLLTLIQERTGFSKSFISRALSGEYNSIKSHIVRNIEQEIIKELKIKQK